MDRALSSEQLRLTRPWAEMVDTCRYRTSGPGLLVARALRVSAVTLNGVAYIRPGLWNDGVGCASLLVHEAVHARDQRERGWWRYLAGYLWWRARHPRQVIRLHPAEAPAYAKADEVGRYWQERDGG